MSMNTSRIYNAFAKRNAISRLRALCFDRICAELISDAFVKIENTINIWHMPQGLVKPVVGKISVLPDKGTLTIPFSLDQDKTVTLSIFMLLGEIRIGFMLPSVAGVSADTLGDQMSKALYGTPRIPQHRAIVYAEKITQDDTLMFDYIFHDGWAETGLMVNALKDSRVADALADGIARTVAHLYCATIRSLVLAGLPVDLDSPEVNHHLQQISLSNVNEDSAHIVRRTVEKRGGKVIALHRTAPEKYVLVIEWRPRLEDDLSELRREVLVDMFSLGFTAMEAR